MKEIIKIRKKIDELDHELIGTLKKRLVLSKELGSLKRKKGIKIRDRKREKEIIQDRLKKSSLDSGFIKKLFKLILKESRRVQK